MASLGQRLPEPVIFDVTTRRGGRGRERQRQLWTGRKVIGLGEEQLVEARRAGYEPGPDGYMVGRDPREMTQAEAEAIGFERMSPMEVIRAKCLDCCGGSSHEVLLCPAQTCPNWLFRTGKNFWRAPPSEAQREASRRSAARMHGKSPDPVILTAPSDEAPADGG
jgi:hypothetical protein